MGWEVNVHKKGNKYLKTKHFRLQRKALEYKKIQLGRPKTDKVFILKTRLKKLR